MSTSVAVPDLDGEDLEGFIQIAAEREFPYPPESLQIAHTLFKCGEERHATIIAVPKDNVLRLASSLKQAKLKPLAFSLALAATESRGDVDGGTLMQLAIREKAVDLAVLKDGKIACLRVLEDTIESESGEKSILSELVARECRITLGQLPGGLASEIRDVKIWGPEKLAFALRESLAVEMASRGMRVSVGLAAEAAGAEAKVPAGTTITPALVLAARCLDGSFPALGFLPPQISAWKQFSERYASRRLAWAGGALAVVAALVGGAFLFQQYQISSLRHEWNGMSRRVEDLNLVQQEIRQFRPWFDDSFRSLSILRRLTLAFPKDGAVTAKSVEIRQQNRVSCAGTARDNQALLKTLDQLRSVPEISDLKIDQLRGTKPVQFTFNFQWGDAPANER